MIKPILRHYGAKATIAEWIVSHFPEHKIYLEPFCGSACVFFQKEPSMTEILNDLDGQIINMFQVLRSKPFELAALIWATPYSANSTKLIGKDELQKAHAFISKYGMVYVGDGNTASFAMDKTSKAHKPRQLVWRDWSARVFPAAVRLKNAQLLQEDAITLIENFKNDSNVLIYVDPPYLGHEREFRFNVEYDGLVRACANAKARILVSEFESAAHKWDGWRSEKRMVCGRGRVHNGKQKNAKVNQEFLFMNFNA